MTRVLLSVTLGPPRPASSLGFGGATPCDPPAERAPAAPGWCRAWNTFPPWKADACFGATSSSQDPRRQSRLQSSFPGPAHPVCAAHLDLDPPHSSEVLSFQSSAECHCLPNQRPLLLTFLWHLVLPAPLCLNECRPQVHLSAPRWPPPASEDVRSPAHCPGPSLAAL